MGRVIASSCLACAEKWQNRPPCLILESKKLTVIRRQSGAPGIGTSCPFVPDISMVGNWLDPKQAIPSPAADHAKDLLVKLRRMSAQDRSDRIKLGKLPGDSVGNYDSQVYDERMLSWTFLYRSGGDGQSNLQQVKKLFGKGALEPGQRQIIENSSKQPYKLPPASSAKPVQVKKATGKFIPHAALTIDNCGVNFEGLANSSNLFQATRDGGYHDNLKMFTLLVSGLRRIEEAARAGFSEAYLRAALKELIPQDASGIDLAIAIGQGIAWQVGLMAGAAAMGVVGGAVVGTFFAPGLGTVAGASAGASLALLMFNYLLTANDLKDTGQQIVDESKGVAAACEHAVQNRMEEAKKAFAKVGAAILVIVLMAILAKFIEKGWGGLQKLRAKHKAKTEKFISDHAEAPKPRHADQPAAKRQASKTQIHGPKGKLGYHKESLLTPVTDPKSVHLRDSEFKTYMEIGKEHAIVLRAGDKGRVDHLESGLWARGKPSWLGQKSGVGKEVDDFLKDGKHRYEGMLAFRKKEVQEGLKRAVNKKGAPMEFDMAMLGDKFKGQPKKPVFEIPARDLHGENIKRPGEPLVILDHKKYKGDREKCYLVQVSDEHFLIVDSLGQPFIQDVDIALIQARKQGGGGWAPGGTGQRGILTPGKNPAGADSLPNEDAINRHIYQLDKKAGKGTNYNNAEHGGNRSSPGNVGEDGRVKWSPLNKDGVWDKEELVAFLPTSQGPKAFKFKGWKEFGEFCDANGLDFPYDKEATKKIYKH